MANIKTGVGLIIKSKKTGRILTLKELKDKPAIEKKSGMISFPLETMKSGERKEETAKRLMIEEIGMLIEGNIIFFGGDFFIVKNARTLAAFIYCEEEFIPRPTDTDVEFFGWMNLNELMNPKAFVRKEVRPVLDCFSKLTR